MPGLRMWFNRQSGWRRPLQLTLGAWMLVLLVLTLQFYQPAGVAPVWQRLEGMLYDAKLHYLPAWPNGVANTQIVEIDEASLQSLGRMPWDRRLFARLTSALADAGAVLVVYDLLFSEPQSLLAGSELQQWAERAGLTAQQHRQLNDYLNAMQPDQQFAQSMQQLDVVLASLLLEPLAQPSLVSVAQGLPQSNPSSSTPPVVNNDPTAGVAIIAPPVNTTSAIGLPAAYARQLLPVEPLASAAAGTGFINAEPDSDGFVRRTPLLLWQQGQLHPSLALQAYRIYSLLPQVQPLWQPSGPYLGLRGVQLGDQQIRTDLHGRILIPFRGGARHYPYTSAADVLSGRYNRSQFAQAVVFVGATAAGLSDLRVTPTSLAMPGVEVHATVFDALLQPAYLPARPDWWQGAVLLQLLLLGMLAHNWLRRVSPLHTLLIGFSVFLLLLAIDLLLWRYYYLELPLLGPVLLVLLHSGYFVLAGFLNEHHRREQVRQMFAQYVPPAHLDRLLSEPSAQNLQGERRQLTVLFCDIRDFTTLAEQLSASQVQQWLNRYFSTLTEVVLRYQGTIDKYVGDMVMAFWGAPLPQPEHAAKALQAALAMQQALAVLNADLLQQGLPAIRVGIGIHSGEMNVGDMGCEFRRSYTVIGDAVNLAARLEGLTRFYQLDLLVSAATIQQADWPAALPVDRVRVKGKSQAVWLLLPLSAPANSQTAALLAQWQQMLDCYQRGDFQAALALLPAEPLLLGNHIPALRQLTELYRQRLSGYLTAPPTDWDGCFTHHDKH